MGKPVSSWKTLGPFLQGFPMHLAGAGIKAWPLLTSPLAGVPMVTQEGLTARPREKSHPNPGYPGREAWGQPCKGCAAHCTKGETESHDKKRGFFPRAHSQDRGLLRLAAIFSYVQVSGKALEVCSTQSLSHMWRKSRLNVLYDSRARSSILRIS